MKHLLEIIFKSRNTTIHWLVVHQSLSYALSCNTNISQHYHTHFNATPHTSQHYHAKKLYKSKSTCCLHKWWLLDLSNKAGQLGKYSGVLLQSDSSQGRSQDIEALQAMATSTLILGSPQTLLGTNCMQQKLWIDQGFHGMSVESRSASSKRQTFPGGVYLNNMLIPIYIY